MYVHESEDCANVLIIDDYMFECISSKKEELLTKYMTMLELLKLARKLIFLLNTFFDGWFSSPSLLHAANCYL